jgi:S-methylmethionine-dependent homocysteine/selenocysteine methylase
MTRNRHTLPQLSGDLFLTDGGIETSLIYHDGLELPSFAAFVLLDSPEGTAALERYFAHYADLANRYDTGLILESPTWRASPDWGRVLGYAAADLAELNRRGVALVAAVRDRMGARPRQTVLSGTIGPRGDGYVPSDRMSPEAAAEYHADQIAAFAGTAADMVTALTLNYVEEAIGVVRAARVRAMPVAISFTVETDGRLPTGETLGEAITRTDLESDRYASYYLINCAHPSHFVDRLEPGAAWLQRIRGVRANASCMSHAELDRATTLDEGDPAELGERYRELMMRLPRLNILGGCCGTDHRHVEAIVRAVRAGVQAG